MDMETRGERVLTQRADALNVRVRSITYLGEDVNAYEVVPLDASTVPAFTAGAHIDLYFRDGRVRQYSLCNDPAERHRYVFAVQREANGRGGSKAIHDVVHAGRVLAISAPSNHFPLHPEAKHHVLVAGGIGVTPIVAMAYQLLAAGASFELHYGARTRDKLVFGERLEALGLGKRLHTYVDGGDPSRGMDVARIVGAAAPEAHIYCCGPEGLMRSVRAAAAGRPVGTVHFEHFVPPQPAARVPTDMLGGGCAAITVGFKVKLARRGLSFDVPDDKSIVEVLRENGIEVATSCEAGLCGTCRTRYLGGEPDHRDFILDEQARRQEVMICCSRSKTPTLELDL